MAHSYSSPLQGRTTELRQDQHLHLPAQCAPSRRSSKGLGGQLLLLCDASLPVSKILEPDSLPILAARIRAGLNAVNGDVVGGLMELRKPCTYDITWWPFHEINEPWILMMTSLYHSELYGVDFGESLGQVKYFGVSDEGIMGGFKSVGFVGAKMEGGGCDVSLGLDEQEEAFVKEDEIWTKFVQEIGGADQ